MRWGRNEGSGLEGSEELFKTKGGWGLLSGSNVPTGCKCGDRRVMETCRAWSGLPGGNSTVPCNATCQNAQRARQAALGFYYGRPMPQAGASGVSDVEEELQENFEGKQEKGAAGEQRRGEGEKKKVPNKLVFGRLNMTEQPANAPPVSAPPFTSSWSLGWEIDQQTGVPSRQQGSSSRQSSRKQARKQTNNPIFMFRTSGLRGGKSQFFDLPGTLQTSPSTTRDRRECSCSKEPSAEATEGCPSRLENTLIVAFPPTMQQKDLVKGPAACNRSPMQCVHVNPRQLCTACAPKRSRRCTHGRLVRNRCPQCDPEKYFRDCFRSLRREMALETLETLHALFKRWPEGEKSSKMQKQSAEERGEMGKADADMFQLQKMERHQQKLNTYTWFQIHGEEMTRLREEVWSDKPMSKVERKQRQEEGPANISAILVAVRYLGGRTAGAQLSKV
uniref:Uncharacterized protein n=1 Tax=Chromera velia CCMP2878 TaxID=1169474 RepID=A0A0G4IDK4_9ALVE|eukprot:Cvel_13458.t1-p1 / transcript=Cvel_13458.t1 / gene=Cvel_13458 / organism=Chromera_velia_CCMP2878 / gene_product=hypothetical protein / transcript_product=hypothetical protein / location=Cvel_scaffold919:59449-61340(-) / protein_length=446 / sequence_SO=supercontig / SO=protein_coding / is_pseudo=false